ncbi:MAG: DUF11 domain-containing protein [Thermoflexales bacterium]|nr:DUF11 domain-containing protein [Thermoflexales bacterium]
MNTLTRHLVSGLGRLGLVLTSGMVMIVAVLLALISASQVVRAGPIPPPAGYPKLITSIKSVTPTLAPTGGVTLHYAIEIRNTGAYTAISTTLTDRLPEHTSYNGDAHASVSSTIAFTGGVLAWTGDIGFDSTVVLNFSVSLSPAFSGTLRNTAVISHPLIARPISATAETVVTNLPILAIAKSSVPSKPGPGKPLTYTLVVANQGQPAANLPITVTDRLPLSTSLRSLGPDGVTNPVSNVVTWTRRVTLELGQTTSFTFSVDVDDVPSGTVIANVAYQVASSVGITSGELYTVTVIDPIFSLSKHTWPDPPGSNRDMTYTLTLLNAGSLATKLVITDRIPAWVSYTHGGTRVGNVVSWTLPSLDTGESAEFSYTVTISDIMNIPIVNDNYWVCSAEDVCRSGRVLTSVVQGPTFEAFAILDPIAKKPGGGGGPVTPTLVVRNLGPGNAIQAMALLQFGRISVSANDLYAAPAIGTPSPFPRGPACGDKCVSYVWVGDLAYGDTITFTTVDAQSTIGGEEGTLYTATVVITDEMSNMTTAPVTGTAIGKVTHLANLIPTKSAPPVIGRGQLLTYTIDVWNSGLSNDVPPYPMLWDVIPLSVTVVSISDGGQIIPGSAMLPRPYISWTLPAFSTGDHVKRTFTVRVDSDLVSGTQILNDNYRVLWNENDPTYTGILSKTGQTVTTTVLEVGLIASFKEVSPALALPGPDNLLTYSLYISNSSLLPLSGVTVQDALPWEVSTYQRDAIASAGQIVSDIVSLRWTGSVGALSFQVVTLSVRVDPNYSGPVTNTAVISHPSLLEVVTVHAVAYITDRPVLFITKSASPDPAKRDGDLVYTLRVVNLGQQATGLVITDVVPAGVEYVAGGELVGNQVRWEAPVLKPGESRRFAFQVKVGSVLQIVNGLYGVTCAEGVTALGKPLITLVRGGRYGIYLPVIMKLW